MTDAIIAIITNKAIAIITHTEVFLDSLSFKFILQIKTTFNIVQILYNIITLNATEFSENQRLIKSEKNRKCKLIFAV